MNVANCLLGGVLGYSIMAVLNYSGNWFYPKVVKVILGKTIQLNAPCFARGDLYLSGIIGFSLGIDFILYSLLLFFLLIGFSGMCLILYHRYLHKPMGMTFIPMTPFLVLSGIPFLFY